MIHLKSLATATTLFIPGPAGDLEVLLSPAPENPHPAQEYFAIICHPHPLFGGTMHNKVVTTLAKTFQQLQIQTLRFNFRGVGQSAGTYAEGEGEQQDLLAIIHWLQQAAPTAGLWLAGFSFGAYIAIRAATKSPCAGLVTIAPPVNHFPLAELPDLTCPWIVVQGDQDEVVPAAEVFAWLEKLTTKPLLIRFPEAGHFFHGQLNELKAALFSKLAELFEWY